MPGIMKPMKLSAMYQVRSFSNRFVLFVCGYAGFNLKNPEELLSEADYLAASTAAVPMPDVTDIGFPKGQPEVLIAGEAQSPGGQPVQAMNVGVSVGGMVRRLSVFGDRFWHRQNGGVQISPPKTFETMPLTADRAFGGPTHDENPFGKGYRSLDILEQLAYAPLPNVEVAEQVIKSIDQQPTPALLGTISYDHPLRRGKVGTPTAKSLSDDPYSLPPDFNSEYFNVAAKEQRLATSFRGDEPISVLGMSAKNPRIDSRLPGLKIRVFAVEIGDDGKHMMEIPMILDTVWVFGSHEIAGIYFHGFMPVIDREASNIETLIYAAERIDAQPREHSYYHEIYALRTDPTQAAVHLLNDTQLMPPLSEAEVAAIEARTKEHSEGIQAEFQKKFDFEYEKMIKASGMPPALAPKNDMVRVPYIPVPAPSDLVSGKVDLAKVLRDIDQATGALEAEVKAAQAPALAEMKRLKLPVPDNMDAFPKSLDQLTEENFKAALDDAFKNAETGKFGDIMKSRLEEIPDMDAREPGHKASILAKIDDIVASVDEKASPTGGMDHFEFARAKALKLPEADPFFEMKDAMAKAKEEMAEQAKASDLPMGASDTDDLIKKMLQSDEIKKPTAQLFDEAMAHASDDFAEGVDFNDAVSKFFPGLGDDEKPPLKALFNELDKLPKQDLETTSKDFSLDKLLDEAASTLDGAEASFLENLTEEERAFFEDTDHYRTGTQTAMHPEVPYSRDTSVRLGNLVIDHVKNGYSFCDRDLAGIDIEGKSLAGHNFQGAFFEKGNFTSANLSGGNFSRGAFTEAVLSGANATGSDFSRSNFNKAIAHRASFDQCRFADRMVMEADFSGSTFRGANFSKITFINMMARGADFSGATFNDCTFMNCDFSGAVFAHAAFDKCMLNEMTIEKSNWDGARLHKLLFVGSKAKGANFSRAHMMLTAFLGGGDYTQCFFEGMVGDRASFIKADLSQSCFRRSDIKQCLFLECEMASTDFRAINAVGAQFDRSKIQHADFYAANLYTARFMGANLNHASMRSANLYASSLLDAELQATDFSGANLTRTVMEMESNGT